MKKTTILTVALFVALIVQAQQPLYKNAKAPIEDRINDLLKRMTPLEKAGQLNQLNGGIFTGPAANDPGQQAKIEMAKQGKVGSFLNVTGANETRALQKIAVEQSRLGIPLLFAFDVIHGYKTIFPIPLAEACSWDVAQIEKDAAVAAKESAAAGLHWTFAPMCDISNDPRWGRVMEGAGEDPYYGSVVAAARVKGLQGNLNDAEHIMACVKHFAAYGAVQGGREYNTVDVSRVALWNKYLPPYHAGVNAGAATLMNAFNIFDGVPASGNQYLVHDILEKKWGFKGIVVSDWNSFDEMITHGYAANRKDAAYKALSAGSMMDMESKVVVDYLPELLKEGKISMQQVDDDVRRVLYYKFKLGLFDDPYKFSDAAREKATEFTEAHRNEARKAADASIVLLKNENNVLPIDATAHSSIALIGYYAKSKADLFDFWIANGKAADAVNIYEGITERYQHSNIAYSDGYLPDGSSNEQLINEAVATSKNAAVIIVNIGLSGKLAGEDRSLANPVISDGQVALLKALHATGKPVVALVSAGRPLVLTAIQPYVNAIVYCWILGTETGHAVADVLSGDYNPSGKTVMSFPYAVGQIPVYYDHFNTGRPLPDSGDQSWKSRYRDIPNKPLYPFGFGLSYTNFAYSNLELNNNTIQKDSPLQVSVQVANTGNKAGYEVAQLYIREMSASIVQPVKALKAFQRAYLQPGEKKLLHFTLTDKDLAFYDGEGNVHIEAGAFKVFVGGNSRDVLEKDFMLK
ncbi:MAG: beta-glucosidase BglX [Hydrotalea flava]|uniref:beta-glucosidase BglX n=1 Tax=unclassified Hydrotalea TaxID=2643788 RepID=UPI0009446AE2|nr:MULTISPECIES: beta-glucosidase BglX [unclassified Hydrotalea]MBY0347017.1 beta-glucosidase BglX [Hydrotalea flava]RWZ86159.1 MAG: beta-glucosidase BglX [Hydrotalea sp. AMD]